MKAVNRIVFVLSLLGVIIAAYVLQGWLRQSNIVCLTTGCDAVRKHAASYPFGIPVPAVGLVGYLILTLCAFVRSMQLSVRWSRSILSVMLGMSLFGVLFVSWFTYTEIFIIRGICMWCAMSAVDMFLIFAFVAKSYTLGK